MIYWGGSDLDHISATDGLHNLPLRDSSDTFGTPPCIHWVVIDGPLSVRTYHGQKSRGYDAAMARHTGGIIVTGFTEDMVFASKNGAVNGRIDEACRLKYHDSRYLGHMIRGGARAATAPNDP